MKQLQQQKLLLISDFFYIYNLFADRQKSLFLYFHCIIQPTWQCLGFSSFWMERAGSNTKMAADPQTVHLSLPPGKLAIHLMMIMQFWVYSLGIWEDLISESSRILLNHEQDIIQEIEKACLNHANSVFFFFCCNSSVWACLRQDQSSKYKQWWWVTRHQNSKPPGWAILAASHIKLFTNPIPWKAL